MNFIHRLLNPHCPDCIAESEDSKVCASCEILKSELVALRLERNKLLEHILHPTVIESQQPLAEEDLKPINKFKPWHVIRQELETKDRDTAAQLLRDKELKDSKFDSSHVNKLEEEVLG